MEYTITTRVPPERIWAVWEQAHAKHGQNKIIEGQRGVSNNENGKGFRYQVFDVIPGTRFSIIWKTLFVKLIFTHFIKSTPWGSEIGYSVKISGFFAWPVRFLLGNKIQQNLGQVLKTMVKQLESEY